MDRQSAKKSGQTIYGIPNDAFCLRKIGKRMSKKQKRNSKAKKKNKKEPVKKNIEWNSDVFGASFFSMTDIVQFDDDAKESENEMNVQLSKMSK